MSTRDRLDLERFEQLLAVHGGRLERWPQAQREPLRRGVQQPAQARARWAEAAELDALLAAAPEIEPTSELVARLASLPARHPRPERREQKISASDNPNRYRRRSGRCGRRIVPDHDIVNDFARTTCCLSRSQT